MKITRQFFLTDRYHYDTGECSIANGFAQIDTSQDASYYGTWANPFTLICIGYCEGDLVISEADNAAEFAAYIREMKAWNEENGYRFMGIDPGCNETLKAQFVVVDLSDLLH